jgi:hypothetical protein
MTPTPLINSKSLLSAWSQGLATNTTDASAGGQGGLKSGSLRTTARALKTQLPGGSQAGVSWFAAGLSTGLPYLPRAASGGGLDGQPEGVR